MQSTNDYDRADSRRKRISIDSKKLKLDIESIDIELKGLDPFGSGRAAADLISSALADVPSTPRAAAIRTDS